MSQRRREYSARTDGALALDRYEPRDYRTAAMRYGAREARPVAPARPKPKAKPRARAWIVFLIAAFFISAFFLLFRQAEIEKNIVELHSLRSELNEEIQRGENLQLELSLALDIDSVQRAAKEEMQMDYPDVEMTRSVELPPIKTYSTLDKATTEVLEEEEAPSLSSWIEGIRGMLAQ